MRLCRPSTNSIAPTLGAQWSQWWKRSQGTASQFISGGGATWFYISFTNSILLLSLSINTNYCAMNTPQKAAKTGFSNVWSDYTTSDIWLVETATAGYIILAIVGVWLSFSAKYIKQILANFALWCLVGPCNVSRTSVAPTDHTPLLDEQRSSTPAPESTESDESAKVLAKLYKDESSVRDFAWEFWFNQHLSWKHRCWLGSFIIALSFFVVLFIIGGVYLARVKTTGPAILDSKKCGLWEYNSAFGGPEAASRASLHDLQKETRAGEYAQNCYRTPDKFDVVQCSLLYKSKLSFGSAVYTTDCPFENEICGQNQTITFTAEVEASELGINSPHPSKFRRTTKCTPLSMEYPFIRNETHNETTTYYYYYGEKPNDDPPRKYTFSTTGDPFESFIPAYEIFAYDTRVRKNERAYWDPASQLTHPEFSTLTLLFISSLRIFYKERSEDPIFPADKEEYLPGYKKPWFRNSDPRARPLACINSIELCLGDDTPCWPFGAPWPKDASNKTRVLPPDFWLMFISLLNTDVYNAIKKRLGRGLIAQSKVSQFFSEGLSDFHWTDEVELLVATTHAMTQINAWSIASGEDSIHKGKNGYSLKTPKDEYGDLCGMFKYNPPGYASIHFIPFLITVFSLPLMWFLSLEWPWNKATSDVDGAGSSRLEPSVIGQQRSASRPENQTATYAENEGITAEGVGIAVSSRFTSAAPGDSEEIPPMLETAAQVALPTVRTEGDTTKILTDDSEDVVWVPLVIGKIIWVVVIIVQLVFWVLAFVLVGLPLKGLPWLGRLWASAWIGTWVDSLGKWILESLMRAYNWQPSRWWRQLTG